MGALYGRYREKVVALQLAIRRAKDQAWRDLLGSLNRDPWGRPYKMALGRLRPWAPPVTESLDPGLLERVVDALFPVSGEASLPVPQPEEHEWSPDLEVAPEEMAGVVKWLRGKNTAPGPDGIPGRVWLLAASVLGERLRSLYSGLLRSGTFPDLWRESRMVLLRKDGRPGDSPSAYRPICLLDEAGKIFEKIIVARLSRHLSRDGPDLADCQFGFREGRSTVDAIDRLKSLSDNAVARGGVCLAVSIDIVNAFNTLPWSAIRVALVDHQVPPYLRRVIGAYLRDRWVEYPGRYGMIRREVYRGVPQGSVLGPLLWDLGYNAVLEKASLPDGATLVCYADDTLVVAVGSTFERTIRRAEVAVAAVVARIRDLGLKIAPEKAEAVWFHGRPRSRPPARSWIRVGEACVEVKSELKYLGLILDSRWSFDAHLDRLVPRVEKAAASLGRLLPNLGGPGDLVRRLYLGVVRSMALYGAPIWAPYVMTCRRNTLLLRRLQRRMAIRLIRGYRTTSTVAALALAGEIPFELQAVLYGRYREKVVALQLAIRRAKDQAWRDLLGSLNRDPWGRPYKMALGRLRPWAPPVTESLDPGLLGRVVDALFPVSGEASRPVPEPEEHEWSPDLEVAPEEMAGVVKWLRGKNTAPGPDGIPGRVWLLAASVLGERLRSLYSGLLRSGTFPDLWRESRMVLLRKDGRPGDSPSAYRPICLLDEAGKIFEKIIVARLSRHLSRDGPDLADCQFGFREGRSTVDAIGRLKSLSDNAVARGGVCLAVSIDIVNAFNTLPWSAIREALVDHQVPPYLRRVIGAYLRDRWVEYPGRCGMIRREVDRGVPQGSVLGPLLWDLGYNAVLEKASLPDGATLVCYADDTLVVAVGSTFERTIRRAEVAVAAVVARIRDLGLKIAPEKAEAVWFHGRPRSRPPARSWIRVGEACVEVKAELKYLGLILDSHWCFDAHLDRLVPRVEKAAASLGRLLPNLGGPGDLVRRLYLGVVRSMALYGAPIWAPYVMTSRRNTLLLRRLQRRMAIRLIRGYRTASTVAALALAGELPFELQAAVRAYVYRRTSIASQAHECTSDESTSASGYVSPLPCLETQVKKAVAGTRALSKKLGASAEQEEGTRKLFNTIIRSLNEVQHAVKAMRRNERAPSTLTPAHRPPTRSSPAPDAKPGGRGVNTGTQTEPATERMDTECIAPPRTRSCGTQTCDPQEDFLA
ncbi:uncharacterized protein LOC143261234 [Megalopta genalis]|uniref:uncharacterized protein LOC143261234 n=1 Tax=Megalopta genalis TaxID=115081 RepID=UPI003FD4D4E0